MWLRNRMFTKANIRSVQNFLTGNTVPNSELHFTLHDTKPLFILILSAAIDWDTRSILKNLLLVRQR